jgi:HlyD family secretion protein
MKVQQLFIAGLCCLVFTHCQKKNEVDYNNQISLQRTPFVNTIESQGELVPVEKTSLQVPRRLWGTLEYLVPEGTVVKKGDVVARVSTRQFTEQVSRYMNNMAESRSEARIRQITIPLEELKSRSDLAEQTHNATLKSLTEDEVRQGPREDERVAARVEEEKAQLQASAVPLIAQEKLEAQGYISEAEVNTARQELLQQETLAKQAELKQIQQGKSYRQPEISKAALETRAAELKAQITRLEGEAKSSLLRTQQLSSKGRSASLGRRVKSIEDRMNNADMTAPFAGTVIYPRTSGTQPPFVGMEVYNGMAIVQVAKTQTLQVLTKIHEFDIPSVKVGQKVNVKALGMPDHPLTGKVSKIQKLARYKDESKPVGLKYFNVEITLDDAKLPPDFKAQMQVNVGIEASEKSEVWSIPLEYLVDEKETFYLWQVIGGEAQKVTVKPGARNANRVVITGDWNGTETFILPAEANAL